jgi:rhamnulokinase
VSDRFLAFDLGAESGRAVLGTLGDDGRLQTEEIHRFPNRPVRLGGHVHWNVAGLYAEMLDAMALCAARGVRPASIGVDTWGVDFGLLGEGGDLLGLPRTYRDPGGRAALGAYQAHFSLQRLYEITGIQVLPINSVFQLYAMVRRSADVLGPARHLLFMPDLFHYWLTGARCTELTFATTSQLYDPRAGAWAREVLDNIRAPIRLMQRVVPPCTVIGSVTGPAAAETGLAGVPVVAVGTHDTASAVAAVPTEGPDYAYLSSGTWSLMGIEATTPLITPDTFAANLTNEGGVGGTFRVLRNITGLWLLHECRRAWSRGRDSSYDELVALAEVEAPLRSLIDPDFPVAEDAAMPAHIAGFCHWTRQPVPETEGEFARCIFDSLALAYRHVLMLLQTVSPVPIRRIHIVGGGSRNRLLCQLTADATGLPVLAGPLEATAIGNLLVQAMSGGAVATLGALRSVVRASFPVETYEPGDTAPWDEAYERFRVLVHMREELR